MSLHDMFTLEWCSMFLHGIKVFLTGTVLVQFTKIVNSVQMEQNFSISVISVNVWH